MKWAYWHEHVGSLSVSKLWNYPPFCDITFIWKNVVNQPSDSMVVAIVGHGVTSFHKYGLKIEPMARPSRIMQIVVPIIPNRDAQKGTLAQKHRIGRPRQPTLQDGCQLLRLVCNGRTKSPSASQRRMAAANKYALIRLVERKKIGWFKQNSAQFPRRKLLITENHRHRTDYRCPENNGSKWKDRLFCNNTDRDFG